MDFSTTLKALKASGFTQKQIANACGCAQSTISDIASGKTALPSFMVGDSLRRLSRMKKVKVHLRALEESAESATAGAGRE